MLFRSQQAVQGLKGQGLTVDYRNQEVAAAWRYLPSLRWGMLVKIDTAESFASIAGQRTSLIVLGMVTLLLVLLVAPFVARSIAAPIVALTNVVRKLSGGDLNQQVPVVSSDEIGELSQAFNKMTHDLKQSYESIEETVRVRTHELQQTNEALEKTTGVLEQHIDSLNRAEVEREQLIKQLQEASEVKSQFLAVMSHELRTPLNAILGFTGVMIMSKKLDERNFHLAERVKANSQRLLALINDILDISRIESGHLDILPENISLRQLINRLRQQMSVLAEEKHLEFVVEIDNSVPEMIYADEDVLIKITTNLLANAFKFTKEGKVSLTVGCNNDNIVLKVCDTGIGIPPHMHEIIFESFQQADSSTKREYGGTGLGLSIVRRLCTAMNGTIRLDSLVGQGSTFTVIFPLVTAEPA